MSAQPAATDVLTDPDGFFARDPSLGGALAVVALNTVLLLVFLRVLYTWLVTNAPPDVASSVWGLLVVVLVVATPIAWFLFAVLIHVVSAFADGEGPFGRTLANVGWGMVPTLVTTPVQIALAYRFVASTPAPPAEVLNQPSFAATVYQDPIMQVSAIVGLVASAWTAYLWFYGAKHGRNLTTEGALASIALPVLWTLYNQLSNLSAA